MNKSPEIHQHETGNKQLAYTSEFKEFIHQNPGAVRSFEAIINRVNGSDANRGDVFQEGDIKATVVTLRSTIREEYYFFKVEIGDKKFFVKCEKGSGLRGYEEFSSSAEARELLKDMQDVEVVDFQLGYQDAHGNSYFVSRWQDLPTLVEYLDELNSSRRDSEAAELYTKVKAIREVLPSFSDIAVWNMFYDAAKKKFYLFDLNSGK